MVYFELSLWYLVWWLDRLTKLGKLAKPVRIHFDKALLCVCVSCHFIQLAFKGKYGNILFIIKCKSFSGFMFRNRTINLNHFENIKLRNVTYQNRIWPGPSGNLWVCVTLIRYECHIINQDWSFSPYNSFTLMNINLWFDIWII